MERGCVLLLVGVAEDVRMVVDVSCNSVNLGFQEGTGGDKCSCLRTIAMSSDTTEGLRLFRSEHARLIWRLGEREKPTAFLMTTSRLLLATLRHSSLDLAGGIGVEREVTMSLCRRSR